MTLYDMKHDRQSVDEEKTDAVDGSPILRPDSTTCRLRHTKSWELIHKRHLPHYLKDNEYLIESHRPVLNSRKECVKSVFSLHTETWNIWTHLLGCAGCILLTVYFWTLPVDLQQKIVFSIFFAGAIFCLGASATYHIFLCHSERYCKFLAKLDYCGIVVLIVASFPPWLLYGFACYPIMKLVYLIAVVLLGSGCIIIVMQDRFSTKEFQPLRAVLFMALGLTGVVPGLHFMFVAGLWMSFGYFKYLLSMAFLYLLGGVIYALRIPEKYFPGKFDIWFQSHQIMHMCVIGGVVTCYLGISRLVSEHISPDFHCNVN